MYATHFKEMVTFIKQSTSPLTFELASEYISNKTLSSLESLSTHLKKIEETLDLGAEQDDFVVASYFGHMIKSADLYEKILRLKTMVSLFGDDEIHEVFERLGLGQINEHNPYTCRGIVNALQSAVKKEPILSGSDYNDPIKLIDFYKKIDCYKITEESTVGNLSRYLAHLA